MPTQYSLEHLEATCDPATFGVDSRDVLDESYRKAKKLNSQYFAFSLDIERAGLLEAIRMGLFSGRDEKKAIHAELYKLNVYGALVTRATVLCASQLTIPRCRAWLVLQAAPGHSEGGQHVRFSRRDLSHEI